MRKPYTIPFGGHTFLASYVLSFKTFEEFKFSMDKPKNSHLLSGEDRDQRLQELYNLAHNPQFETEGTPAQTMTTEDNLRRENVPMTTVTYLPDDERLK